VEKPLPVVEPFVVLTEVTPETALTGHVLSLAARELSPELVMTTVTILKPPMFLALNLPPALVQKLSGLVVSAGRKVAVGESGVEIVWPRIPEELVPAPVIVARFVEQIHVPTAVGGH
jgi:hypothetical protein